MATFFFDNDISFRVVHALRELVHGNTILALRDVFPVDTLDTTWSPQVGRDGWIVISRDHNQRRREAERTALKRSGVRVLHIRHAGTQDTLFADAARLIKNWPKIERWGLAAEPGTLARLNTGDEIERL